MKSLSDPADISVNLTRCVGVSIKAGYRGLPPPVGPLTVVCLDFITENNDANKKRNKFNTTMTTDIFKFYKTAQFLMPRMLEIAFPSF